MFRFVLALPLAAALALAGCKEKPAETPAEAPMQAGAQRMVAPVLLTPDAKDIHSYAIPAEARVTHVALNLTADFEQKILYGTATLHVAAAKGARRIILDDKGLEIVSVRSRSGEPLRWQVGEGDDMLGRPLEVELAGADRIVIEYRSAPDAAALQWLTPEQTAGKRHPFLFSQGQAILNRTWIPTQDSPGIRQTWEARIVVPAPLKAVMSGEALTPEGEPAGEGRRAFKFRMDKPVAPYLIALAAGDIAFQSLGPRTGVWAEPVTLKAAANELGDTEKMVDAAEALYGPYRWGRYDMIVLPPSFPFGGMENPMLTFLTPTMLAGDRSLTSLIAHELAHSWSGNLVTNATWADFWLNEGITTYIESRIMEALYGPERAQMLKSLGWEDLQNAVREAGGASAPATQLHLDLKGQDPDEGMADIAYEKGAAFLRTIEAAVGRERFDAWLRSYFDRYAFQPITTRLFLEDLRANLVKGDAALEQKLQLDAWAYRPGIPSNAAAPVSPELEKVAAAARAYGLETSPDTLGFNNWGTHERVRFLNALPRDLGPEQLQRLDGAFKLSQTRNSEVLFAWLRLAIANRYDPAVLAIERFLTNMGRRKFVEPLFRDLLAQGDWGRPIAERVYAKARPGYHAVTAGSVDALLKPAEEGAEKAEKAD